MYIFYVALTYRNATAKILTGPHNDLLFTCRVKKAL